MLQTPILERGGSYTKLTAEQISAKLFGIAHARSIASEDRRMVWQRCWTENQTAPYFNSGNPHEHRQFVELRDGLFAKYFDGLQEIVEFGCGAGDNLLALPGRRLRGYDWSEAAVERCRRRGIEAEVFDMLNPELVRLGGCGVFTVHALEQLGTAFPAMLAALYLGNPAVVVHIEPIYELYDPLELNDFLAMQYHNARGYLKGFLPYLQSRKDIDILEITKPAFGNINHRAYSTIVWRTK